MIREMSVRKLKLLTLILRFLLGSNGLQANDQTDEKLTALCIISKSGDWIGKGRQKIYFLKDGEFNINNNSYKHQIHFTFNSLVQGEYWDIRFGSPKDEEFHLGVYKNAKRSSSSGGSPGLEVNSDHSGCNRLCGEFEILELEYDEQGKIKALAANFVQRCEEKGSPLFGSIRVNSSIPIEAIFKDRFKKYFEPAQDSSAIYLSKRELSTGEMSAPILITDKGKNVEILPLPFGGEGVQVLVEGRTEQWMFDFSAPIGHEFIQGKYETSCRYPFNGCFEAGIGVTLSRSSAARPAGFFEVFDVQKNRNGQIYQVSMYFSVETELGEVYEGTICHVDSKLAESEIRSDGSYEIFSAFFGDDIIDKDEE